MMSGESKKDNKDICRPLKRSLLMHGLFGKWVSKYAVRITLDFVHVFTRTQLAARKTRTDTYHLCALVPAVTLANVHMAVLFGLKSVLRWRRVRS